MADFHSEYARKLKKVRSSYDSTNDLFSAYSFVFSDLLHLDEIVKIAENRSFTKRSEFLWVYRGLWQFYSKLMSALVRITSSDLRFWLTDEPYIAEAYAWAEKDYQNAIKWLSSNERVHSKYSLSLETTEGLEQFWNTIDTQLKRP